MSGQFRRVAEKNRPPVHIEIDGEPVTAFAGDTVLVAVMLAGRQLRQLEHAGEPRAGFCLMGACQDCWIWRQDGGQLRACTTYVEEGMAVLTTPSEGKWPANAS